MKRRQLLALAGSSALLSTASALAQSRWISPGPRVPDVELLDHTEQPHALRPLFAVPTVVSFFYTGCASLCPPQTAALRELHRRLHAAPAESGARAPLLLSITLDPLSDTPQALREYAERFAVHLGRESGWLMLTGDARALSRVWTAFDAPVDRPAEHTSMLWIGDAARHRWTRASALTPTDRLLDLLTRELA